MRIAHKRVSSSSVGGPLLLRRIFAPALVIAGMLLSVPTAGAVPLPPTPTPLPGSSFQGADGDQADSAPWIDWTTLQGTGRVQHAPDPNAQDSAFKDGTKEDVPGEWDFANEAGGVKPSQENILDAWASVEETGDGHVPLPRASRARPGPGRAS